MWLPWKCHNHRVHHNQNCRFVVITTNTIDNRLTPNTTPLLQSHPICHTANRVVKNVTPPATLPARSSRDATPASVRDATPMVTPPTRLARDVTPMVTPSARAARDTTPASARYATPASARDATPASARDATPASARDATPASTRDARDVGQGCHSDGDSTSNVGRECCLSNGQGCHTNGDSPSINGWGRHSDGKTPARSTPPLAPLWDAEVGPPTTKSQQSTYVTTSPRRERPLPSSACRSSCDTQSVSASFLIGPVDTAGPLDHSWVTLTNTADTLTAPECCPSDDRSRSKLRGKQSCSVIPLPWPSVSTGSTNVPSREVASCTSPPPGSWGRGS